jgi:hypothetical protein
MQQLLVEMQQMGVVSSYEEDKKIALGPSSAHPYTLIIFVVLNHNNQNYIISLNVFYCNVNLYIY